MQAAAAPLAVTPAAGPPAVAIPAASLPRARPLLSRLWRRIRAARRTCSRQVRPGPPAVRNRSRSSCSRFSVFGRAGPRRHQGPAPVSTRRSNTTGAGCLWATRPNSIVRRITGRCAPGSCPGVGPLDARTGFVHPPGNQPPWRSGAHRHSPASEPYRSR
jgi:hypothetical protein